MANFNLKLTKFSLFWNSDISWHSFCCQWRSSLMTSNLLLGFWVPEPLWLSFSISNCYSTSKDSFPHQPIPFYTWVLNQSLETPSLNIIPENPLQIQTESQDRSLPHRNERKTSGLYWRAETLRWQSDSSSAEIQFFPKVQKVFRKQERQSSPSTMPVYESKFSRSYHNLCVTFKLGENITSVHVILIIKCPRTSVPPRAIGKLSHCSGRLTCNGNCLFSVDFIS